MTTEIAIVSLTLTEPEYFANYKSVNDDRNDKDSWFMTNHQEMGVIDHFSAQTAL